MKAQNLPQHRQPSSPHHVHMVGFLVEQVGHMKMVVGPLLHPQPLVKPHCAAGCLVAQVVVGPPMLLLAEVGCAMLGARSLGNVAQLVQWALKGSHQQTLIYLGQIQVQCTHSPSCLYIQWHCQAFLS